jgi:hypothetical protein
LLEDLDKLTLISLGGERMKRCLALTIVLLVGGLIGGCFGPVVRPTADFTWCPDGERGLLDYRFFSHSTTVPNHYITELTWEFGDGTEAQESYWDVIHRFREEGTYFVTLIATDDRGISGTVSKEVSVHPAAFIREWDLTLGFPATVTGVVENRYEQTLYTVTIKAKFYDYYEIRLTDGAVEISDLKPGERAFFTIKAPEHSSRIFYATVAVESFAAECPDVYYPAPVQDDADHL